MLAEEFYNQMIGILGKVRETEMPSIMRAAEWIADSIAADGLVHLFGCGHSHLLAEDIFLSGRRIGARECDFGKQCHAA